MSLPEPPATTRLRLIASAARLLAQRSYGAAGVDELCRSAEAKKGSFYHFFRSKSDLAVAAVHHHWGLVRSDVFEPIHQSGAPGLDRLTRLVIRIDALQQQGRAAAPVLPGSPFGNLGQEMAHQDEQIRVAVDASFQAQCLYVEAWLDEAVRTRQVPAGDNTLRARQVLALIEGALLSARVAADPALFLRICAALPAVAGRGTSPRPAAGTPPELL